MLNLWQKNNVFSPEVIQPLLDMADPNHPLHQEILQQQQNSTANGKKPVYVYANGNKKALRMYILYYIIFVVLYM